MDLRQPETKPRKKYYKSPVRHIAKAKNEKLKELPFPIYVLDEDEMFLMMVRERNKKTISLVLPKNSESITMLQSAE